MSNAKILIIKTGLIETLTFPDGSSYESAIRKKTVPMVKAVSYTHLTLPTTPYV